MTQLERLLKAIKQKFFKRNENEGITVGELIKVIQQAIEEERNILREKDSEIKKDWEE